MNKKSLYSFIGAILSIISLFICIVLIPALLMTFMPLYLGFIGALLFAGLIGLINELCIGLILWSLSLVLIIKTLKKLGVVKQAKTVS